MTLVATETHIEEPYTGFRLGDILADNGNLYQFLFQDVSPVGVSVNNHGRGQVTRLTPNAEYIGNANNLNGHLKDSPIQLTAPEILLHAVTNPGRLVEMECRPYNPAGSFKKKGLLGFQMALYGFEYQTLENLRLEKVYWSR